MFTIRNIVMFISTYLLSKFVQLEVIPKAVYNKQTEEAQFYEEFFSDVTHWASDLTEQF